ncbi:hypothetical protein E2C01_026489 [Portunus trituberculatus]|uniref:Uncharacterized protein n=1 Tax=Portunus trituberculatus TaxID=210409 RepID=A0A5B7EIW8_PORTR|nr:hypothetical protein [Portunus trituberculatus]
MNQKKILVNYRQIEEIPSVLSAGRLQMKHEKSGVPTYQPAAELCGAQFKIAKLRLALSLKMRLGQIAYKQTDHAN